ncbi:MAG: chromate efflux transporter [Actinomycetota bacterium]|nr:chromate efflux transporter [Actinomycetota bacterium]
MDAYKASLKEVAINWSKIGIISFGGPPTHIRLLRELCVSEKEWIDAEHFEDAIATCNLLPGPTTSQLAIYSAWKVRGTLGALLGGFLFIAPGLILVLVLASIFISRSSPKIILAIGEGAGATVAAIAAQSALNLLPSSWERKHDPYRWVIYVGAGVVGTIFAGPLLVLVLLACGVVELLWRRPNDSRSHKSFISFFLTVSPLPISSVFLSVAWVAFKVGALSYGGGFIIVPLMRGDAVSTYHWMSSQMFLSAVALGQITPGPVVQTVAVVGYSAAGVVGGLIAALVAFSPSFVFVLVGARHFTRVRQNIAIRHFLDGAGPAAIGAILGASVPLTLAITHLWQFVLLFLAALLLVRFRISVVIVILGAGCVAGILFYLGVIGL